MEFMNLSLYSSNWNISHLFCVGIQCIIKFAFFRGIDMYNRFHETVAFLLKLVCSLLPFVYLTSGHFELCNQYYDRQAINLRYASYSGIARIPEEGGTQKFFQVKKSWQAKNVSNWLSISFLHSHTTFPETTRQFCTDTMNDSSPRGYANDKL